MGCLTTPTVLDSNNDNDDKNNDNNNDNNDENDNDKENDNNVGDGMNAMNPLPSEDAVAKVSIYSGGNDGKVSTTQGKRHYERKALMGPK